MLLVSALLDSWVDDEVCLEGWAAAVVLRRAKGWVEPVLLRGKAWWWPALTASPSSALAPLLGEAETGSDEGTVDGDEERAGAGETLCGVLPRRSRPSPPTLEDSASFFVGPGPRRRDARTEEGLVGAVGGLEMTACIILAAEHYPRSLLSRLWPWAGFSLETPPPPYRPHAWCNDQQLP